MRLPVLPAQPRRLPWRGVVLPLYRAAVVVCIVWLIHRHHTRLRIDDDAPIQLSEVQLFLPTASRLKLDESDRMGLFVEDSSGKDVGYVLRTAPISNQITGYVGPTDSLIVLDADMRVIGVKIRSSEDTKEHVRNIAEDDYFLKTWNGKTWDEVAGMDPKAAGIEGVSGASLTSLCIANGIQHRFQHTRQLAASQPRFTFTKSDAGVAAVVIGSFAFAFTRLRSYAKLRRAFQVVLIGYLGFVSGRLLSQSLLSGWSQSSVPWRSAPGLVLLTAAALLTPWTTRRALYCTQLCPHGALQEWAGRALPRWHIKLPRGVEAGLRRLAPMLVALVIVLAMINVPFNLAALEPFDAYLVRTAGAATIIIAILGVISAAFVPTAYCKFGCPTGSLLSFVRSHGKADRFSRKDMVGGLMVILTIILYLAYDPIRAWIYR